MCKSVDGVTLGMKTLLQNPYQLQELDHSVVPIPWRHELYNPKTKLKIGWWVNKIHQLHTNKQENSRD